MKVNKKYYYEGNDKKFMGKHDKTNDVDTFNNLDPQKYIKKDVKKKGKKKKHIGLKIFLLLIIVLGIFIAKRYHDAGGNWLGAIMGHNKETLKNLEPLQVLILGESTGMSDTIIVASYNPQTQEAALMSIPRDTFTGDNKSSAKYYHKINALYGYGETPEKTLAAVNKITGLDIKYYILVDTKALKKLVETIGGLDFDVPIDMDYDDSSQDLYIHLKAGQQKLNGEQVEQLVRFRHNNNGSTYPYSYGIEDHGRSKTQRAVVIALAKQSLKFKNIAEISNVIDILKEYVKTNMDLNSVKDYLPYAIEMNMDNIQVGMIPGADDRVNGIWFFFHDEEGTKELVDELFLHTKQNADSQNKSENQTNSTNE